MEPTITTGAIIKTFYATYKWIKDNIDDKLILEVQRFSVVKLANGEIKKIQLSFQLYNNKPQYKVIQGIKLSLNDTVFEPLQQFKYKNLEEVESYKPFFSFFLGEKASKELDVEFQGQEEMKLEENNNIKLEILTKDGKQEHFEFAVVLDPRTIQEIKNFDTRQKNVLFIFKHQEIGVSEYGA